MHCNLLHRNSLIYLWWLHCNSYFIYNGCTATLILSMMVALQQTAHELHCNSDCVIPLVALQYLIHHYTSHIWMIIHAQHIFYDIWRISQSIYTSKNSLFNSMSSSVKSCYVYFSHSLNHRYTFVAITVYNFLFLFNSMHASIYNIFLLQWLAYFVSGITLSRNLFSFVCLVQNFFLLHVLIFLLHIAFYLMVQDLLNTWHMISFYYFHLIILHGIFSLSDVILVILKHIHSFYT